MITDADTNKLLTAFKKVFPTKESLKDDLNDMRSQILDSVDGKLKAQEKIFLRQWIKTRCAKGCDCQRCRRLYCRFHSAAYR